MTVNDSAQGEAMTDLLPPYHKPMTSELDCDLANDRVAALEAELERVAEEARLWKKNAMEMLQADLAAAREMDEQLRRALKNLGAWEVDDILARYQPAEEGEKP